MSSVIYPIAVVVVAFAGLSAACWFYFQWRQTIGGMHDDGASVIADQGDDWAPFPCDGQESEPVRTVVWVIGTPRWPIEVTIDETRPAWHSAVGVQTVEFSKPATTAFTVGGDA